MSFPAGLSVIEFLPFLPVEEARDDGGGVWQTMDADTYWRGRATTSRLSFNRLQDWEGFVLAATLARTTIEFVDPIYRIPAVYRSAGALPGGFDGIANIEDLSDPLAPVVSGLPVGLVLKRGDRIGAVSAGNKTCHLLTADVTVASGLAQALPVVPPVLSNVFAENDKLHLLSPVIRLNIVPNSWSAPRRASTEGTGSFEVVEASIVTG